MDNQESSKPVTLTRLLFATDFSPASERAFEYATSIAERYRAEMYVAHVIDLDVFDLISSESTTEVLKQAHEEARQKMAGMITARGLSSDQCHIVVTHGVVADALIGIMRQYDIELAVLGTHGRRAFKKLLLGSIAEEVFRIAPCAVLTVGPKTAPIASSIKLQHILYPVEFAPDPSGAGKYAISLAERYGAKLTVMNVAEDMPASASKQEPFPMPAGPWIEDHISKSSGLRSRLFFERGCGPAAEAILEFASNNAVDVIVLGVRRQDPTIAAHLPKSDTAYELVSRAPCPVLTIRG
ncbi:MAG TPA: universal stress protein [Terriglobales bacterium]|nr:universal stress protein [Terriglobales bacterium]